MGFQAHPSLIQGHTSVSRTKKKKKEFKSFTTTGRDNIMIRQEKEGVLVKLGC